MFCSKCGKELSSEIRFCPNCGNEINKANTPVIPQQTRIMLDPSEVINHAEQKDSCQSFSGQGRNMGLVLIIVSIIIGFLSIFTIGLDIFIPLTILEATLFFIGFMIRLFCP